MRCRSRLQAKSVRREYSMRGDQRSASLHLSIGLQGFAFGRVSSRVRKRQRVPSTSRVLVVLQMREPLQMWRERGMPSRKSPSQVYLPESKTFPFGLLLSLKEKKRYRKTCISLICKRAIRWRNKVPWSIWFFLFQTYVGNPYVSCRPECTTHSECSPAKPACLYQKCVNPCDGVCGVNADCNLRGITPVCSCPKHMTGNPFVSCRLFEPRKHQSICNDCQVNH